ncbi:sigma-54-dependent Fis family transcriptional regulator [Cohaesibacter gelatinilyticus]|uniref:Transcriptional regulator of acetoin/glycerol metabolism n=1 Tax=Cohaesibacter gelatinilyticus TaxID=372072 RepID=A0A285PGI0_9HYPH|nr:sigma-54-dependent Fis family transcriptional regulator [Cohaesibacter gelatinilyticus]SNZ20830.1 Transcriptional regulator of acetoin/glycerol metabolism [Cohaesibacter gelatinilyticus]
MILSSWERCRNEHGLEKEHEQRETVVRRERVRDSIESLGPLFAACRSQVQHIFQNIVGSGHAVILTDNSGTIIDFSVQSDLEALFRQSGLRRGADWSEDREGTNGIGTAITEKKSVTIYRDQHFYRNHAALTCTGAPILDVEGEVLALFDVSSIGRKDDLDILAHTRALLEMSARLISRRNFQDHFSDQWILRFHQDADRVGLLEEGLLALDHNGRIVGVDEMALSHLGANDRGELISIGVEDLFAMKADKLAESLSQSGRQAQELWLAGGNNQLERNLHARLVEPASLSKHSGLAFRSNGSAKPVRRALDPVARPVSRISDDSVNVRQSALNQITGSDPSLQVLAKNALKLFEHDVPLLVTGETGVGKDSFSRALHEASSRFEHPFVAVNCGALPENLIEGELFGYKAGAFTGAQEKGFKGQILAANGGTLMLDEIGDMPLSAQTRLLQVLEQRKVMPLGSSEGIDLDIRLIAATHQSLKELCAQGKFREDLYFRLCGFTVSLPALREREDLAGLVSKLSEGRQLENETDFDPDAVQMLRNSTWPGNIRQLKHVLKTAIILADEEPIRPEHLQMGPMGAVLRPPSMGDDFVSEHTISQELGSGLQSNLQKTEYETILSHLRCAKWNVSKAARSLGLSRNTLYRKMKIYSINRH